MATQLVQVGPLDPHFCSNLRVQPNLILPREEPILGRIIDQSGEPFKGLKVELRAYVSETKQIFVDSTETDQNGHFHLKPVKRGTYRLLASQTRAFAQPGLILCTKVCTLSITLRVNPTDMRDSQCPIK